MSDLTLAEYQNASARTLNLTVAFHDALTNYALGLAGETGEVIEMIKKQVFHDKPADIDALSKELGDVLWYISSLATTLGIRLDEVAQRNVDKLKARYPEGFVHGGGQR